MDHTRNDPPHNSSPTLYENPSASVFLLDIPASIAHAQGHPAEDADRTGGRPRNLISVEPLERPFLSTEPKTAEARDRVRNTLVDVELTQAYEKLIAAALHEISQKHVGPWCLPRKHTCALSIRKREANGMLAEEVVSSEKVGVGVEQLPALFDTLIVESAYPPSLRNAHVAVSSDKERSPQPWGSVYANHDLISQTLKITTPTQSGRFSFTVPPKSTFSLSYCDSTGPGLGPLSFDLVILDPPWPNRSVRRRRAYGTIRTVSNTISLIQSLNIPKLLIAKGFVGTWITNKPAVRKMVLDTGGLFDDLNLTLVEEWIWIKTTVNGEPVTQLDGVWRKPYEVFLLGRIKTPQVKIEPGSDQIYVVKRRVIAGVPDLHSRKPCLKQLLERYVLPKDYKALEVFARYLVAGWTSWGNEALMYNWHGFWEDAPLEDERN